MPRDYEKDFNAILSHDLDGIFNTWSSYIVCDPIQTSCLFFDFFALTTEDFTSFPMNIKSVTFEVILWKCNFYKVCISFYFIYIWHTILFIISE